MMKKILFCFCFLAGAIKLYSQATNPISCTDGKAYIVMQNITGTSGISGLYSININTGEVSLIKNPIIPASTGITARRINCLGYNETDGFLYGYRTNSNQIIRIDSNGNYDLITVTGLTTGTVGASTAGDVYNNELYIFKNSTAEIYKINLATFAVSTISFTTPIPITNYQINDFAFGKDGNIYGITQPYSSGNRKVFKVDLTANTLQFLGDAIGSQINSEADDSWGTAFIDSAENLYVGNNGSRNTYKFKYNSATQTYSMNATLFAAVDSAGQVLADGASCEFTLPPNTTDDEGCINNPIIPQTININVLNNDLEGTFPINSSTVRLIDPVTSLQATSVTISNQGTFSVNSTTGEISFSSLSTFSQSASIKYVVMDNVGNISDTSIISVKTCYCTQPPTMGTTNNFAKFGVTLQKKQGEWPLNIPNGYIALESKEKGMVVTRVNHVSFIPQNTDSIVDPKEGMLLYDIQDACIKLFNGTNWQCIYRSCNN